MGCRITCSLNEATVVSTAGEKLVKSGMDLEVKQTEGVTQVKVKTSFDNRVAFDTIAESGRCCEDMRFLGNLAFKCLSLQ
jgi:metal-sulfur cluster biosynthetic enzyme